MVRDESLVLIVQTIPCKPAAKKRLQHGDSQTARCRRWKRWTGAIHVACIDHPSGTPLHPHSRMVSASTCK